VFYERASKHAHPRNQQPNTHMTTVYALGRGRGGRWLRHTSLVNGKVRQHWVLEAVWILSFPCLCPVLDVEEIMGLHLSHYGRHQAGSCHTLKIAREMMVNVNIVCFLRLHVHVSCTIQDAHAFLYHTR